MNLTVPGKKFQVIPKKTSHIGLIVSHTNLDISTKMCSKLFFKGYHPPGMYLKFIIVRDTYFHHIK